MRKPVFLLLFFDILEQENKDAVIVQLISVFVFVSEKVQSFFKSETSRS